MEVTFAKDGYTAMLLGLTQGLVAYAHLYTNDPAIGANTHVGDFVEASYEGYQALPLWRWTPPALQGGVAFSVCDPLVFKYLGIAEDIAIRGYYATAGPTGPLLWAWRRPGPPFTFVLDGRTLMIFVRLQFPIL